MTMLSHSEVLIEEFEELTKNAVMVQAKVLQKILKQNACTDYLKNRLNGLTVADLETFKSRVPLITYADIEEQIQKICDGEPSSLLSEKPVDMFFLSSGTSKGRPKLIPAHYDFFDTTVRLFQLSAAFRERHFPLRSSAEQNGKVMDIVYCGKQFRVKGGILSGAGTTNYFCSEAFKRKQQSTSTFNSSPNEVIFCSSLEQATYCHLLFGLLQSHEILFISSTFLYTILEAFRFFEKHWQSLADCIEHGQLPAWITDSNLRHKALEHLQAESFRSSRARHLAAAVRSQCGCGFRGIISRLWPNAKYIFSIMTGTMLAYYDAMRLYAGTNLPLICGDYGASESWVAINTDPLSTPTNTCFTIVPDLAYFEFIPLEQRPEKWSSSDAAVTRSSALCVESAPVSMSEVKVGHEYEIVITTNHGLYRYRLGDVVRICGFHNAAPQFEYICRRDVLLSIHIDKNGEIDLAMVMERAADVLPGSVKVAEYAAQVDVSCSPGHYMVYVEMERDLSEEQLKDGVIQEYCNFMDAAFVEPGYVYSRATKTIGPLELCLVERGTFHRMVESALEKGATMNQYKTPRCIAAPHLLAILGAGVIHRVYSQK